MVKSYAYQAQGDWLSAQAERDLPYLRRSFDMNRDPYIAAQLRDMEKSESQRREEQTGGSSMVQADKLSFVLKPPKHIRKASDRASFSKKWNAEQRASSSLNKHRNNTPPITSNPSTYPTTQAQENIMSERNGNAPVKIHEDGSLKIKIWNNQLPDGNFKPSARVTKPYKDRETGEWRETQNLNSDDMLKLSQLAGEARQTMRQIDQENRDHRREETQSHGLERQHKAMMENSAPRQENQPKPTRTRSRSRSPEI